MPEFRREPLSGRWVIIAEDRAGRPTEFSARPTRQAMVRCPFCAGNEHDTPQSIAEYPLGIGSAGEWQVRVIPNKYPGATRDAAADSVLAADSVPNDGSLWMAQPAVGAHEVIIESPRHAASLTELTDDQVRWSFQAYRDRLQALRADPRLKYGLVFKNCRGAGGATLEHAHSQLLATCFVPYEVEQELRSAAAYFDVHRDCLYCELLRRESAAGVRLVSETERFVAYSPFASRFPYETWIVPRAHASRFEGLVTAAIDELAALVQQLLRSMEQLFPEAAYNYWIHTAPFDCTAAESFHWHLEVIPRLTTQAGYEWGSGCFVNPVAPETAARQLRRSNASRPD